MKIRAALLSAMVAAAADLVGIHIAMPNAVADSLPNGYSVTCTPNGQDAICNVSGCPRVKADEAGDVIHLGAPGYAQTELSKGCNSAATFTLHGPLKGPQLVQIQGCRKHSPGSDDCGAWSNYTYNPPAPAAAAPPPGQLPVRCSGGPDAGKLLPPGSTCVVAAAAPTKCPTGSLTDTVPAGQQCVPPHGLAMNISRNGLNANVAISNNSGLPAKCSYTATKSGGFGPQEVDRSVDIAAHGKGSITDMLWPPLGTSYNAVVTCTVNYDGKQTSIGQVSQTVKG